MSGPQFHKEPDETAWFGRFLLLLVAFTIALCAAVSVLAAVLR